MKATGIVRKVDELGRVVLPVEIRRTLGIAERDPVEIYLDGDAIILKKYLPVCVFCGSASELEGFRGKKICAGCLERLRRG